MFLSFDVCTQKHSCVSDWWIVKCLCASSRWELLWHLCREFQSESELQAALQTEAGEEWMGEEGVVAGWKEEEVVVVGSGKEEVQQKMEVTLFLVELEFPSFSVFPSACSPLHSASWRTSGASPWEQTLSWHLRSAPASTAGSRCGRRSAAYRAWSGTGA